MLDPKQSRVRQSRLVKILNDRKLDAAVIGLRHHVYYFSAFLPGPNHSPGMVVFADGRSWLTTPNQPAKNVAADDVLFFQANCNGTLKQEQPALVGEQIRSLLKSKGAKRIGLDASAVGSQAVMGWDGHAEAIDAELWQMRRPKDPDELELMKKAIECSVAMYKRAREIIEPGVSELTVFSELHGAAVQCAGEPMSALLGNDYACGVMGGPARKDKKALDGQLYILDLGPAYHGYFADNCRTFSVNRKPTEEQLRAAKAIEGVFPLIERIAKPGTSCRELFTAGVEHLKKEYGSAMGHHLGHGVGLQPHEFPHLNPAENWDDQLVEGEVFTCEPGLYNEKLNGGIRIENQYVVTKTGVQNLVNVPTSL